MLIDTENAIKEAREKDHACEFCYYELFDDKAYPCSRCVNNLPTECGFRPKRNSKRASKWNVDVADLEIADDGICIEWVGNIGWGTYSLLKDSDGNWTAHSEYMDKGDDKEFIRYLLNKFVDEIEILE